MKYAYQRGGAPLLDWTTGPPRQSRAADSVALGSLGSLGSLDPGGTRVVLPRAGAPEVIVGSGLSGCACSGSCGCGSQHGLSDYVDAIPGGYVTLGAAALVAWMLLRKKRRR